MNCCICGAVKNCERYLDKVFENIEKIGSLFDNYTILLFYDESDDNTLYKLIQYRQKHPNRMFLYVNKNAVSSYRTHNIAHARNTCLEYIKKRADTFPYFIMMDFDDVNCKNCDHEVIRKYLKSEDDTWDALSFNTSPKYYDIWALSIYPYCFSYNHFKNNYQFYTIIQNYVMGLLNNLPPGKLLPCISAFNGFAIYKTAKFLHSYYDGKIRSDLIPEKNMKAHSLVTKSPLIYTIYNKSDSKYYRYETIDCRYEDCEHRAFHIMARQNNAAKIMISPEVVFY